jgi:hypothetical protein
MADNDCGQEINPKDFGGRGVKVLYQFFGLPNRKSCSFQGAEFHAFPPASERSDRDEVSAKRLTTF